VIIYLYLPVFSTFLRPPSRHCHHAKVAFAWHHILTNTCPRLNISTPGETVCLQNKNDTTSGLMPAITATDINARLQVFGRVLAVDGVGVLNAMGEYPARDVSDAPHILSCLARCCRAARKFAYMTLELPNLIWHPVRRRCSCCTAAAPILRM
jgi:hypothetical protein